MRSVFLSYDIDESTPAYGNGTTLKRDHHRSIAGGDSCNTQVWHLPNHLGTHIDAPRHFSRNGATVESFPADFWVCRAVTVIQLPHVTPGQIIGPSDLSGVHLPPGVELLLIHTGFSRHRGTDLYVLDNPGFDPDLADYLRQRCPALKMIGFDVISLSGFGSRPLGRRCHQAFLDHCRPILVIEDMDLTNLTHSETIQQVVVCPLRVARSDGAPCTVVAMVDGEGNSKRG